MQKDLSSCEPLAGGGMNCSCECSEITLEVSGYFGLSPVAQVLVNQVETDEIVVVGWVDGVPISLPSGANPALIAALNDMVPGSCLGLLAAWEEGFRTLVSTQADVDYANAFLLKNTANSKPPTTINPDSLRSGGDYRLFNRFKARVASTAGQIDVLSTNGASVAVVGTTTNPCARFLPSASAEIHPSNGARGVTSNRLHVYQLNEGRIGSIGQKIDRTLNYYGQPVGSGTPWIWSAIRFNADGSFALLDHQIFPTYSVYKNGVLIQTLPQSAPSPFIAMTSSSQRTPGEIN